MNRFILALMATIMCTTGCCTSSNMSGKSEQMTRQFTAMKSLHALARARHDSSGSVGSDISAKIAEIISGFKSVDELGHAARMCYSVAYPQMAEDVSYDMVFDAAMWECVRRIAAIPGTEAAMELTNLRPVIGADGHSSELMKALILKQQRPTD